MSRGLLILLLLCAGFISHAQNQKVYWVYFTDKAGSTFDPYSFFDPAAIARRVKNNVSLNDYSDYPVSPSYLDRVQGMVDTLGYASRWLNAVSVVATDVQIANVQQLSCVHSVVLQPGFEWQPCSTGGPTEAPVNGQSQQVRAMQGEQFASHNIIGKGINICILDAGFWGVDSHESFSELRLNGQIKATRNFLKGDSSVYACKTDHGTSVLSCIAGKDQTQRLGMAPGANFLLGLIAKEYGNQYRAEEHYIAGVEWADQKGAHIINISGGPNQYAYFPEQRDGQTTVISFACKVAARKGILVVAASGNNGENFDRQLLAPAETDSVLSVTALGDSGFVADYSAVGPPPDFRRKPDVCAPGDVLVAAREKKGNVYAYSDGTSFSAPLVTGFAACLMEKYPEITAMGTIDSLRRCSHLYPYYDYAHGYGMPMAGYFFRDGNVVQPSFGFQRSETGITVQVLPAADSMSAKIEDRLLFWNFTDSKGRIVQYNVIDVTTKTPVMLNFTEVDRREEYKLCVWYKGYYAEADF